MIKVKIHVLIPSFNCKSWINRCLTSVKCQKYQPTQVLVIDDASTEEGYLDLLTNLCRQFDYNWHHNAENLKCPRNLRIGIDLLSPSPDDVIFLLDGDDFLPTCSLKQIAKVYEDPDIWLTYGSYRPYPHDTGQTLPSAYPQSIIDERTFRIALPRFNHPITFRAGLWSHITDADLQNDTGQWFRGGYDTALMIPLLEMSAPHHFRFLDGNYYWYNAINPISDSIVNRDLVNETGQLRDRPVKPSLQHY